MTIPGVFLSFLSGFLLTAAFPKIGISWLAYVALVPILLAVRSVGLKTAFQYGFVTGMAHYLSLMVWLIHTLVEFGHIPVIAAWGILMLFAAYLALYPALFAVSFGYCLQFPPYGLMMPPLVWTGLEYIRSFLMTGFPWEFLGYSQHAHLTIIQIADALGVYGVSFLIVAVNLTIFLIIQYALNRKSATGSHHRQIAVTASLITAILLIHVLAYGDWRIRWIHEIVRKSPTIRTAVIQGNIDQAIKWDPAHQVLSLKKYLTLSKQTLPDRPELIVWPETAAPFYFMHNTELTQMLIDGVRDTGTAFLFGSPFVIPEKSDYKYYNSAFVMTPEGNISGRYDKTHLVPFGEYVPFQKWLPFIGKLVESVGDFQTGDAGRTLLYNNVRLGVLICYEQIFPALSRQMAQNGADILISMTNDAWYGGTSAPYQHFSMAVFRAVENRRAVVRAANTGISGFIDPTGNVLAASDIYTDAAISQTIPLLPAKSIYTRFGDMFAMGCLIFSAIFWMASKTILQHTTQTKENSS